MIGNKDVKGGIMRGGGGGTRGAVEIGKFQKWIKKGNWT